MEKELPCIILSTENFTPDEKRSLLFDVNRSLEISMEDFDENWWPFVSNIWTQWNSYKQEDGTVRKIFACRFAKHRESSSRKEENISNKKRRVTKTRPSELCLAKIKVLWLVSSKIVKVERYKDSPKHTHSLLESDRIKRSQAVRTLVENEVVKNYSAPAITSALKEHATNLGLGTSISELKRKEVANIKFKVRGPLEAHLFCDSDLKSDISKSMSFLIEKGYRVKNYRTSRTKVIILCAVNWIYHYLGSCIYLISYFDLLGFYIFIYFVRVLYSHIPNNLRNSSVMAG